MEERNEMENSLMEASETIEQLEDTICYISAGLVLCVYF